ncbi:hypothetical protein ACSW8Q_16345 (plasmid) [Clostridium perfringens]
MIESLIVKSGLYKNKEIELKENEIKYLSDSLEELKRALTLKEDKIKSLEGELSISKDKFKDFINIIWIMAEVKIFKNNFLNCSNTTKNEFMFHDKDKIYINKKFLEEKFFLHVSKYAF